MDGLRGKIKSVGNLSGTGHIDRESIHPSSGKIVPVVSYETETGTIVSDEIKKVTMDAFVRSMNDTNTRYKIVQDRNNKYKFFLYKLELGETKWELQDVVEISKTLITTGSTNGTIAINGEDVKVKGLKNTAFTDIGYFVDKYSFGNLEDEVEKIKMSVTWEDIEDE